MTVVYERFNQTSAGGFEDLDGLLCVQRRLKFMYGRNEALGLAVVVEPKSCVGKHVTSAKHRKT